MWPTIKFLLNKQYIISGNLKGKEFYSSFRMPVLIGYFAICSLFPHSSYFWLASRISTVYCIPNKIINKNKKQLPAFVPQHFSQHNFLPLKVALYTKDNHVQVDRFKLYFFNLSFCIYG